MRVRQAAGFLAIICILFVARALLALSIEAPYESYGDLFRVTIIGDDRGPLNAWPAYRQDRYHPDPRTSVEARRGERYTIRVNNVSGERIALVISVDGLNIISGQRSYGSSNEGMYVLDPGQTGNFSGWRSGMSHVQRFYFTSAGDSYAGRMGQRDQLGIIKVLAFREHRVILSRPYGFDDHNKSAPMRESMQDSGPGTGYGENTWDPVSETEFTPNAHPSQTLEIKYEWSSPKYYQYDGKDDSFAQPPPR